MKKLKSLSQKEIERMLDQYKDRGVWKDTLVLYDEIKIGFWLRLRNLFYPKVSYRHTVQCKEAMPKHEAYCQITYYSYIDLLREWYRSKFMKSKGTDNIGMVSEKKEENEEKPKV